MDVQNFVKKFDCSRFKFLVSGQSKQTSKELYTHVQCSPASAGLAQAHLNKSTIPRFSDFLLLQHIMTLL